MDALKREQVLSKLERLPIDKLAEVIDFIEFIEMRSGIVTSAEQTEKTGCLPDIDDLVGQLDWQGDTVDWQRKLRDEW